LLSKDDIEDGLDEADGHLVSHILFYEVICGQYLKDGTASALRCKICSTEIKWVDRLDNLKDGLCRACRTSYDVEYY